MYPWHLPNRAEGCANKSPPLDNTQVCTKSHVTHQGGCSGKRDCKWFRKQEVLYFSRCASYNSETEYTSLDYGKVSSRWPFLDEIPQWHEEEAPIDDRPRDYEYFPGNNLQGLPVILPEKPTLFTRKMVIADACNAPDYILCPRGKSHILKNTSKMALTQAFWVLQNKPYKKMWWNCRTEKRG